VGLLRAVPRACAVAAAAAPRPLLLGGHVCLVEAAVALGPRAAASARSRAPARAAAGVSVLRCVLSGLLVDSLFALPTEPF
jgi:hypothetical protein